MGARNNTDGKENLIHSAFGEMDIISVFETEGGSSILSRPANKDNYSMEKIVSIASNYMLVKDMTNTLDFDLINQAFDKLKFTSNIENDISEDLNFFDRIIFSKTRDILVKECETFLINGFNVTEFDNLKMTNSWGNVTKPGKRHHEHTHAFSVVSGVIYLDNNPCNYNLKLEHFYPEVPYFLQKNGCKIFASLSELLPPDPSNLKNHLILFLSNTHHRVETTSDTDAVRKSISFNTFWNGHVGSKAILNSYEF